jgi:hypothetical protein
MTSERSLPEPLGTPSAVPPASTSAYPTPAVGCPVVTAEGDKLGTVKEVQGTAFKVNAHLQPDYWLSCSSIRSVSTDRVELAFPKDRLGDYKQDPPGAG